MLNQKGNTLIGLLFGLIIAAGLFGVYYFVVNKPSNNVSEITTVKQNKSNSELFKSSTPTAPAVSDKKLYTNTMYGYLFEYPSTAFEVDDKSSSLPNIIYVQTKGYTYQTSQQNGAYQIEINAVKDKVWTLEEYIHSKDNTPDSSFIKSQVRSTINGNPAVITTYKSASDDPNIGSRDTQKQYYVYSKNMGIILTGSGPLDTKNTDHSILDEIASSLKFTN